MEEFDASVDAPQHDGKTATDLLQRTRRRDVRELLTQLQGRQRKSGLISAVAQGDVPTLTSLLAGDISVKIKANKDDDTLVHIAASKGDIEVVRLLMEKGASVDETNMHGETPLHVAAKTGNLEVVSLLVKTYGADITTNQRGGLTPVALAKQNKHVGVVLLLNTMSEKGASPKSPYPMKPRILRPEDAPRPSRHATASMSPLMASRMEVEDAAPKVSQSPSPYP